MKKQIIVFGVAITALVLPAAVVITEAGDNFLQPDQIMQIHGLWAVVLLMFQFILTSRVRFLDRWIGLDRLIHAHRFIGIAAIAAALVHTLMYSIPAALQDYLIPELPDDWAIAAGMLSLTLLLLLGITAAAYRKLHLKYDTWRRIHQTAYIILPLVLLHAYFGGTHLSYHPLLQGQMLLMTAVVAGLLLQRLFRTIRIRRNPQAVTEVYRPTHDTTSVRFTRPEGFSAQPGQFAILRFHGRELKEAPHPYTLSDISNPEYLEITAKAIGDFSSEIPRLQKRDTIYVDGPHGIFTPVPTEKSVLWIAGGIGITPFLAALRSLQGKNPIPVTLVWGNKTPADICYEEELKSLLILNPTVRLMHVFSDNPEPKPDYGESYSGFVTREILSQAVITVLPETYLCGPPVMRKKVLPILKELGIEKVHYERFSL